MISQAVPTQTHGVFFNEMNYSEQGPRRGAIDQFVPGFRNTSEQSVSQPHKGFLSQDGHSDLVDQGSLQPVLHEAFAVWGRNISRGCG